MNALPQDSFLARLVATNLGPAAARAPEPVRPRQPYRYEMLQPGDAVGAQDGLTAPLAPGGPPDEGAPVAPGVTGRRAGPLITQSRQPPDAAATARFDAPAAEARVGRERGEPAQPGPVPPESSPVSPDTVPARRSVISPAAVDAGQVPAPETTGSRREGVHTAPEQTTPDAPQLPEQVKPISAARPQYEPQPVIRPAGPPETAIAPAPYAETLPAAEAPPVRVSIGRVEVTLVAPPTPAPAQPTATRPRPKPVMSLQEYLERRQGGGE